MKQRSRAHILEKVPEQIVVKVLYHGELVTAIGLHKEASGWVLRPMFWVGGYNMSQHVANRCIVNPTTVTDITEGFGPVVVPAAVCGTSKLYLNEDKFISGHLYRSLNGRLFYLLP